MAFGESPVDLPGDAADADGLRWTVWVLAISGVLLLLFNSFAVSNWAGGLEPSALTGPIKDRAEQWSVTVHRWHLDAPVLAGRKWWAVAKAADWPGGAGAASSEAEPAW